MKTRIRTMELHIPDFDTTYEITLARDGSVFIEEDKEGGIIFPHIGTLRDLLAMAEKMGPLMPEARLHLACTEHAAPTVRDHLACAALAAMGADRWGPYDRVATEAYKLADAMMEARKL